jgi:hypothetical protein
MSKIFSALLYSAAVIVPVARVGAQVRESEVATASKGAAPALSVPQRASRAATRTGSLPDSAREYDAQALRFETSWGNVSILRGANNSVVGTAGWFRDPGLEKLLVSSPRALSEARVYETNNFRGSLVGSVGALATLVGIVVTANGSNDASSPILIIGGVSSMVWGAHHLSTSYSALSRALWWYNRDLAH